MSTHREWTWGPSCLCHRQPSGNTRHFHATGPEPCQHTTLKRAVAALQGGQVVRLPVTDFPDHFVLAPHGGGRDGRFRQAHGSSSPGMSIILFTPMHVGLLT